jgi:CPA2 family monovalent cation:H+ antiporter-2
MLLDLGAVVEQWMPTLGLLAAILVGKFIIILATAAVLRLPLRVGILSAAALFQVGEFSFVLLGAAPAGLLDEALAGNLLVAIILSMMLTPLAIAVGPELASNATRVSWLNRLLGADPPGVDRTEPHAHHVLVAGYGMAGREVCRAVRAAGFPYVAVDANPDNVRLAREAGDRAVLGDITQNDVIEDLACSQAVLVVLCINDPGATELATRNLRAHAPLLPVIVRTPYEVDKAALEKAGATEVITAESTVTAALVRSSVSNLPVMTVREGGASSSA